MLLYNFLGKYLLPLIKVIYLDFFLIFSLGTGIITNTRTGTTIINRITRIQ